MASIYNLSIMDYIETNDQGNVIFEGKVMLKNREIGRFHHLGRGPINVMIDRQSKKEFLHQIQLYFQVAYIEPHHEEALIYDLIELQKHEEIFNKLKTKNHFFALGVAQAECGKTFYEVLESESELKEWIEKTEVILGIYRDLNDFNIGSTYVNSMIQE